MSNSVELAGIIITLVKGYPICLNDVQTWKYKVEFVAGPPTPGISNFAFGLCKPQHDVIRYSPSEGADYSPNNAEPCLYNKGINRQMKWDRNNDNVKGEYAFSLQGCFKSTDINVAVHTGGEIKCHYGFITGPSCEVLPPTENLRGIDLSALKDSTISY